jgi:hypothetical protein
MALQRRYFKAIAAILQENGSKRREHIYDVMHIDLARAFADYLATENPLFDRERFLDAAIFKGSGNEPS